MLNSGYTAWRTQLCHVRSKLRSEKRGRRPSRCWVPPGCLYHWREAPPQRRVCRSRICRRRIILRKGTKSHSGKRKSPTSAWRRSTFSTKKTLERSSPQYREHSSPRYSLPEAAAAAAEAVVAAEAVAAEAVAAAEAASSEAAEVAAAAAACHGEPAAGASPEHFAITVTNGDPCPRWLDHVLSFLQRCPYGQPCA
jgi:cytochrome c553